MRPDARRPARGPAAGAQTGALRRYGVKVFVVPADLTAPGATQRLYEEAKESGKPVDVLQRVALLLTHPDQQCTTLAQKSSWANVAARMVGMVQLHCKPL